MNVRGVAARGCVGILQHVPWEGPGRIATALTAAGLSVETRHILAGDPLPPLTGVAGLVVMGGPMRATDAELGPEVDFLAEAVALDVPVLGICLGHQLLGLVLGGALSTDGPAEIGIAPVDLVADSELGTAGSSPEVLHWHGDQVSLPAGAELLARSPACGNQAFRLGPVWGLQFHLEVDRAMLRRWLTTPEMLADLPEQADLLRDFAGSERQMAGVAAAVFSGFADRALLRARRLR